MKVKLFTIATHALVWVLLLVIPYISTDQVFNALDPSSDKKYLLLCLALSAVLIIIFYFNYFLLIPKFLLTKKYWSYFSLLLLAIVTVFLLSGAIFFFPDFNSGILPETNPSIEKIFPVIIVNALLLWLLSIVSSILWTVYSRLKQTESEKLSAQIASLKSQINPHFLFNTLNNIYATAIDSSPKTADMVDKLSEMMRYTMKDTQQDFVLLEDEINYISNYIELQKLRLDRSVKLEFNSLDNIPDLRIAPMLLIPFIENAFGKGRAYGLEILLKKNKGKLTGWLGYTLSKTERQINGINNGQWYNAKQDRTHDLSIVGIYTLSPRWTLSGTFIYSTGNAVTFPTGKYVLNDMVMYQYGSRNADRMPATHRLDFSATYEKPGKRKFQSSWSFGLYNVYGRKNPYSITFKENKDNPQKIDAIQTSLFQWVPSVTYNFKF